jgi:VCBS repeat-containing protein
VTLVCAFRGLSRAQSACSAPANAIVAENCQDGSPPSEWDLPGGASDVTIQGFSTDISVNVGGTIYFKISTPSTSYKIDIYRVGYYGGNGARKIATIAPSATLPQTQPACLTDSATGLIDCGNWGISASWAVPADAVSGVYVAHLVRQDVNSQGSHIVFVVRNDSSTSDLIVQTSDTTWQAYNNYGGNSLYVGNPVGRAYKVSYNRPIWTREAGDARSFFFSAEYPLIRWLESNGYDVSYMSGVDVDRYGSRLLQHKVYISSGHDEYWSGDQRKKVEAARDKGVHLAFISGNQVFWKTRWESSVDGSNAPYRTLVCYKETRANAKIDPTTAWTGTWRDPRFTPPSDGGRPENALSGVMFNIDADRLDTIQVPSEDGQMRFWRNTSLANQAPGAVASLIPASLGYEWDEDVDNGFRPAGLIRLSTTQLAVSSYLQDWGQNVDWGTGTHHMTLYRASSGALVFGAGTVRWAWGLDGQHDNQITTPDSDMQQATVNLFADMGVQPATLQFGLLPATKSADISPPVVTVTSPTSSFTTKVQSQVLITGTAQDSGGGVVGGIEVSTDGGSSWHPATGRSSWFYTWTPSSTGVYSIQVRAVDDSGNIGNASASITANVGSNPCPCSLWSTSAAPNLFTYPDPSPVELGLKFQSSVSGFVTGIRFYKGPQNTGTHIGKLYDESGNLLASATFTNESSGGWQQVRFLNPVSIAANTTYVASYWAPNGNYSMTPQTLLKDVLSAPLTAVANTVDSPNPVLSNGQQGFPTEQSYASNNWVDLVFVTSLSQNHDPVASPDTYSGSPGRVLTVAGPGVLANDTDADNDPLRAIVVSQPAHGTLVLSDSGAFSYTPGSGFSGTDSFTYRASDGQTSSNTATVTLNIGTQAPAADGEDYSVFEGQTLNQAAPGVLANDTDPQALPLQAQLVSTASHGTLALNANGSFSYQPAPNYTGTDAFTYVVSNGTLTSAPATARITVLSFTAPSCPCTIFGANTTPSQPSVNDTQAVELGVAFRPQYSGFITGIRFYKGSLNTGTHVAHLWSSTGQLLATANFSNESSTGWQQANFPGVTVSANTTYIASYYAPNGGYAAEANTFSSAVINGPLTALVNGAGSSNGLYIYGGGFPSNGGNATNYWVDVVYNSTNTPGTQVPAAGNDAYSAIAGQPLVLAAPGVLANDNDPQGFSLTAQLASTTANGTLSLNADGSFTYTPQSGFTGTDSFTYKASDGGSISQAATVTITVTVPAACPCTIFANNAVPSQPSVGNDSDGVELGVAFRSTQNGFITGIRFYKGDLNTGTHTAHLWSVSGQLLATATFSNETPTGWQQVNFPAVAVSAGNTYVASYYAPNGGYAANTGYFTSAVSNGPLTALASNGVYLYGGGYPSNVGNGTNYWVDVVFNTSGSTPQSPTAGNDSYSTASGQSLVVAPPGLLANDSDPQGYALSAHLASSAANGTVNLNADGSFTYSPNAGFTGSDSFTYTVSNGALSSSAATVTINVSGTGVGSCPCSIFASNAVPTRPSADDTSGVELGVAFRPSGSGFITGIRFYKGALNTGAHTAHLWSSNGQLLGTATFTNETATGWQQVNFAGVAVSANTTYIASYYAPNGGYAADAGYFANAVANGPLTAPGNTGSTHNGLFVYGGGYPTNSGNGMNYWVDVVYNTTLSTPQPPSTTNDSFTTPQGQTLTIAAPGVLANDVDPQGYALSAQLAAGPANGTASLNADGSFTYTPQAGFVGTDTFTYKAFDGFSTSPAATVTITVSAAGGANCPCSIFGNTIPSQPSVSDPDGVELGMAFAPASSGFITGIRFYKGTLNTGTHTAHLWSSSGQLLATATFTNETATGWQQVNFPAVPVSANTTYVVSYYAPNGGYAADGNFFSSAITNGPLTALANGTGTPNGLYVYGGGFPTGSGSGANYWVDVVYSASAPAVQPPVASADSYSTNLGQPLTVSSPGVLANDTDLQGYALSAQLVAGPAHGTISLNANGSFSYTPAAGFAGTDTFTYKVSDGPAVSSPAAVTISVSDTAIDTCPCNIFGNATPALVSSNDGNAVELGVAFVPTSSGYITGIRFYKGSLNTGTHVAHLWSSAGQLLATATFANETATGWQQVSFPPVAVTANTIYVASYLAPEGGYAADANFFVSPITNGPLSALANSQGSSNGLYLYGGGFPTGDGKGANYWVDVVYSVSAQ